MRHEIMSNPVTLASAGRCTDFSRCVPVKLQPNFRESRENRDYSTMRHEIMRNPTEASNSNSAPVTLALAASGADFSRRVPVTHNA